MDDVAIQKKRFRLFLIVNGLMSVLVVGGIIGEFLLHIPALRPVWMLALLVGFSVQLWLILGLKKSMSEKGR